MDIDRDCIDEAVLALLFLGRHDGDRTSSAMGPRATGLRCPAMSPEIAAPHYVKERPSLRIRSHSQYPTAAKVVWEDCNT